MPYTDRPPRLEYHLTPKGRDLWKVSVALREWGDRWDASGFGTPSVEMVDSATGRPVTLALIDSETGEVVPPPIAPRCDPGRVRTIRSAVFSSHQKDLPHDPVHRTLLRFS